MAARTALVAGARDSAAQALPDAASIVKKYVAVIGGDALRAKSGMHTEGTFTAADGLSIYHQAWLPDADARVVVMLIHGLGEHSGRYAHVALTQSGAGVVIKCLNDTRKRLRCTSLVVAQRHVVI